MRQADLLNDINQRYHWATYPNRKPSYSRRHRHRRGMMIFRVRTKGPNRAKAAGWLLRREMSRMIGPGSRIQSLLMEIATGPNTPLLMREKIVMSTALGGNSPIEQRWGQVEEYTRTELGRRLEVSVILLLAPRRTPSKPFTTWRW
ncbi:hypothetical protein [Spirosoma luteolum]